MLPPHKVPPKFPTTPPSQIYAGTSLCGSITETGTSTASYDTACNQHATFVLYLQEGTGTVTLCEVQVTGYLVQLTQVWSYRAGALTAGLSPDGKVVVFNQANNFCFFVSETSYVTFINT